MEPDSIEVIEEQVITKIFKVRLGTQTVTLDDSQAFVLYQQLKQKFQKQDMSKSDENTTKSNVLGNNDYEGIRIPTDYKWFATKKSQLRIGKSTHKYHYFRNSRNEYGFLIKNGITKPFVRLGSVNDNNSPIGKIIRASPQDKTFKKSFYVKSKEITINNQTIKAVVDILELEGFLKVVGNTNSTILSYRVTKKGLEIDDNIEPLKVQLPPTQIR